MAYTRGAQQRRPATVDHMDDGELVIAKPKPAVVYEAPRGPSNFLCTKDTVTRDIEAYDLFLLIDKALGGINVELTPAEWISAHPDLRRHFKPVA